MSIELLRQRWQALKRGRRCTACRDLKPLDSFPLAVCRGKQTRSKP